MLDEAADEVRSYFATAGIGENPSVSIFSDEKHVQEERKPTRDSYATPSSGIFPRLSPSPALSSGTPYLCGMAKPSRKEHTPKVTPFSLC